MSEQPKHVLLREDLAPAFDEAAALEAMEAMADEAGDWHGHVPYAAARSYRDDPEIRAQYDWHVDDCTYCRRMIDALNPSKELLADFHELLQQVRDASDQSSSGDITTWMVDYVSKTSPAGTLYGEFLENPAVLQALEAEQNVTAKFKAARIYLDAAQQQVAYERIGEGCALANIDAHVVHSVTAAAKSLAAPAESLADSAREFAALVARQPKDDDIQQLRLFEVLVQLGQHYVAMESLHTVLTLRGGADEVVEALEEAELVGVHGGTEPWKAWFAQVGTTQRKLTGAG